MKPSVLTIRATVLEWLLACARAAGRCECMGLLASPRVGLPGPITAACLLPAEASAGHALAEPLTIGRAARLLRARGLRARGLWHSHADAPVYISGTDTETAARLLPAMSGYCFEPVRTCRPMPTVTANDRAVLPLADGRSLHLTLVGPRAAAVPGREQVVWAFVDTALAARPAAPNLRYEEDMLHLEAGGVRLSLGVPEGATVVCRPHDPTGVRVAHLFSLVINKEGDFCAEVVVVHDVDGESFLRQSPCEVKVVGRRDQAEAPVLMTDDGAAGATLLERAPNTAGESAAPRAQTGGLTPRTRPRLPPAAR